ncbi:MAG TPA: ABC transporter ATP-binding protein [Thermomicrobiales bacterium]|nr:ABC transporter ATP-binding protein [Thermomicrobiales bacterium]
MNIFARTLSYLLPYWRRLVIVYVSLFLALIFQLTIPDVLERAIDHGVDGRDGSYLARAALLIVGLSVLQAIFTFIRSYGTNVLAEVVGNDLRDELYAKFEDLPFQFYDRSQTGQLMSRATEDINNIRGMMMFSLRAVVQAIGMLVIVAIILFQKDWRLALVSLSTTPILIWWSIRFGISIRPVFLKIQQQFGAMTSALQENVAGGRVVRAFAQEKAESERFEAELQELFERNLRASSRWAFNFPATLALNGLSVAGVVWFGGYLVLKGQITVGTLVAFQVYTTMLQEPIRWLGFVVQRIARSNASAERIFEVFDTKPAIRDLPGAKPLPDMKGVVTFRDVQFRYPGTKVDALHDVSFTAEPGQIVALVGPTGSGKSSVVSLIPRFYDVHGGTVAIDGVNVRDITLKSLRSQIGIVMQESFLFSMTVRENIAYGDSDASFERVVAAAKAAKAHDFILRMQDGYDTVIGERGVTLSGGQKQRLAIARALLIDPRILILDDSTASVDSETEHDIQEALRVLMKGRTSFVIAQRLSTVQDASQVLVFQDGTITQRGTHAELVNEDGFYRELYDLQMRDQEEASASIRAAIGDDPVDVDALPEQDRTDDGFDGRPSPDDGESGFEEASFDMMEDGARSGEIDAEEMMAEADREEREAELATARGVRRDASHGQSHHDPEGK